MKPRLTAAKFSTFALAIVLHGRALAQERPTLLVGHGTLSGSILPL